jgi:hypothetical protein
MNFSAEKIKITQEIIIELVEKNGTFNISPKSIFSHKKWIGKNKINMSELLKKSGINPDCILDTQKGKYKKDNSYLKQLMIELASIVGKENLNDNSLHKYGLIEIPKSMQTIGDFPLSDKLKIPLKKINTNSLMRGICRTFDNLSWGEILNLCELKEFERKKSAFSPDEILVELRKFIEDENQIKWNIYVKKFPEFLKPSEFKNRNNKLFKLINRVPEKIKIKLKNKNINQFSIGLFILMYLEEKNDLAKINEHIFSIEKQIESYSLNSRLIKKRKGNEKDIQKSILEGYVNGYFGYKDYFGDQTLYRHINHQKNKNTKLFLKKMGIETDSLRILKSTIESKYNSKEKVWKKFRELVSISIQLNQNCLTREYLEKNEPDFIRDCFRLEKIETNSWEKVLSEYGLSPDIWSNSYSVISHKGNIFQKSIFELISKYLKEVKNISHLDNKSFIHNKLISTGIKPDFIFSEFIVDSKLSVSIDKNKQIGHSERSQIEKYSRYFNLPVYIITLNQNEEYFYIENHKIKNINFRKDFKKWMNIEFSINISDKEIANVFTRVNNIPFWKIK